MNIKFEKERKNSASEQSIAQDIAVQKELHWFDFNVNFHSSGELISSINDIAQSNMEKEIDLRPYMIERPYCVYESDKLSKIVEVFRLMNLRHLPVINECDNTLQGIITR